MISVDVAVLDYGTGNLHSLVKALECGGARVRVEAALPSALSAAAIVLPGVGSFAAAAAAMGDGAATLREALARGLPCLGICLGMQLLFETSAEGEGAGIAALPGRVRRLRAPRIPHMGWNSARAGGDALFDGLEEPVVYYANSYAAEPAEARHVIAWTEYAGDRFPAAVRRERTWGVQFHPEKSGAGGLRLLANFLRQVAS